MGVWPCRATSGVHLSNLPVLLLLIGKLIFTGDMSKPRATHPTFYRFFSEDGHIGVRCIKTDSRKDGDGVSGHSGVRLSPLHKYNNPISIMERKENPKVDYTTTADCKDLHTQAVEVAENLRKSQEGKVYTFIPHPTLPKTWVRKEVK